MVKRVRLHIKGRVQGVGFRPFIYNLATKERLAGFVLNDPLGVSVELEGDSSRIKSFVKKLRDNLPPPLNIEAIEKRPITAKNETVFSIRKSVRGRDKFVFIAPDLALCRRCLDELLNRNDRRFSYPFINCTHCGPRYSVIFDIPYDRAKTTMKEFTMCKQCKTEYSDFRSRRFHAQPSACFTCGPQVSLLEGKEKFSSRGKGCLESAKLVFMGAAERIGQGGILAVKGIGGYHLCCDAKNKETVSLLRRRKKRPSKPFALMVDAIETINDICYINNKEREVLTGPARPIVLLKIKRRLSWMDNVAPGQKFLGAMLCYTPVHHLLFSHIKKRQNKPILVMTSANLKDNPLVKDERELAKIRKYADAFLVNNRKIFVRCDDSVTRVYKNKEYVLRKARGYVPDFFEFKTDKSILACGAELKAAFSIVKNGFLITSQYLGDLKSYANYRFFIKTLEHFKEVFHFEPDLVAYDSHPAYLSSQYALSLKGKKKIAVQHHHAHAASCMLENGLNEKVIAVVFDGIGFGPDRAVWGGEFFICDRKEFKRAGFFDYFAMIGKDKAVKEPRRVAFYILHELYRERVKDADMEFMRNFSKEEIVLFKMMIKNKSFVYTSSVGRLFDAVASLLNIRHYNTYEGEAAVNLEMAALDKQEKEKKAYAFDIVNKNKRYRIKWQPLFGEIIDDVLRKKEKGRIAFKFHYTLSAIIKEMCQLLRRDCGLNKVVFSGGVFQNWLLLNMAAKEVRKAGFDLYTHSRFPPNDGCISLGQAAGADAVCKG
ncbi:MAG: carbamoyltransferase HypF [Candidatus Omnitrophota bacterium]